MKLFLSIILIFTFSSKLLCQCKIKVQDYSYRNVLEGKNQYLRFQDFYKIDDDVNIIYHKQKGKYYKIGATHRYYRPRIPSTGFIKIYQYKNQMIDSCFEYQKHLVFLKKKFKLEKYEYSKFGEETLQTIKEIDINNDSLVKTHNYLCYSNGHNVDQWYNNDYYHNKTFTETGRLKTYAQFLDGTPRWVWSFNDLKSKSIGSFSYIDSVNNPKKQHVIKYYDENNNLIKLEEYEDDSALIEARTSLVYKDGLIYKIHILKSIDGKNFRNDQKYKIHYNRVSKINKTKLNKLILSKILPPMKQ
ncbi:MAG: hypothetical protein MRY83_09385 [Flavobacteriales bacterium]|nr:hypothetical protein [Flavobacteriales bacterium]